MLSIAQRNIYAAPEAISRIDLGAFKKSAKRNRSASPTTTASGLLWGLAPLIGTVITETLRTLSQLWTGPVMHMVATS
ncbi:uncharacterized protein SAPINGB_P004301 [Magnusiomyces paraingens]|uniref:Uncharacterized protein n=1 Tax=Magnusiomyces paraingens TaxID=2606893 RepID=A0A5E8C179_9ASCO|nr:uncharacterized protein SAPINGB_P004301 [Saprochaete ingens]VVT54865.1 unnamed protein product [Saprochaete ingens]